MSSSRATSRVTTAAGFAALTVLAVPLYLAMWQTALALLRYFDERKAGAHEIANQRSAVFFALVATVVLTTAAVHWARELRERAAMRRSAAARAGVARAPRATVTANLSRGRQAPAP